jgi:hypothetical protein
MAERINILFRPHLSERIPAGILATIPVKADTAATKPTPAESAPRCEANKGRTGLFDMVELKMAKSPVMHSNINGLGLMIIRLLGREALYWSGFGSQSVPWMAKLAGVASETGWMPVENEAEILCLSVHNVTASLAPVFPCDSRDTA